MRFTRTIKFSLVAIAGLAFWSTACLGAVSTPLNLRIESQPLASALQEFAKQSGIQVIFFSKVTDGFRAPALQGQYTVDAAIKKLLGDSKLTYRQINPKTIEILPSSSADTVAHGVTAPTTKPSNADGEEGKNSSSGRFRVAQVAQGAPTNSAPVAPTRAPEAVTELKEITVIATRRPELSQKVPISITAFTGSDLNALKIIDQGSLANNTPSMVAITSGAPQEFGGFALRGQGPAYGATPGTIAYFSEVPDGLVSFDGRPGTYFDLASVQVLKGPQGTLFGKNATGGNVLFEPQQPTNQLGGYAQLQSGNYNDREFEGALNLPIVNDKVMLRVAGAFARRDGYTTDVGPYYPGKDYDNLGYQTIRVGLLIRPVDGLDSYTVYRYYHSADNGPGTVLIAVNPNASQPPIPLTIGEAFPNIETLLGEQQARGPREVSYNINEYARSSYTQLINDTSYSLTPSLLIKNIASYSRGLFSYAYDYDATPDPIAGQSSPGEETVAETYFTEELQLQGKAFGEALHYVVGGFEDRQWPDESSLAEFNYFPDTLLLGAQLQQYLVEGTRSHAEFAQLTYDFGTLTRALEGVSVTGGYRYTHDEAYSTAIIGLPTLASGTPVSGAGSWNYGSYTFGINDQITPRILLYVSDRDAFKAGGFNTQAPASSPYAEFAPEKLVNVEGGVKSDFDLAGMAARANLDVFHGNYTNIQRTTPTVSQGVLINLTTNAAQALIQGVEFEGILAPVASVELSANYAYTDSKYTKVTAAGAAAILAGAAFPYVPRNKVTFSARYTFPLPTDVGDLSALASYTYTSSQSVAQTNQTVFPYFPGYGLVNARLDWHNVWSSGVDVSAFVTNLTNKTYAVGQFDAYETPFGFVTRPYGPPRMYGVQLRYAFRQ